MAIYYIDLANGSDANNGTTWALAWKTITSGATAARIAPGDEIRISKTPDPISIGNADWTGNTNSGGGLPLTVNISATANNGSGLVRITSATHGLTTGDVVQIVGLVGTQEANGAWKVTVINSTTFDLDNSTYLTARTSGGTVQKINAKAVVLASALTRNVNRCKTNWTGANDGTATLITSDHKDGGSAVRITLDAATQANKLQGYQATGLLNLSAYQTLSFWFKNSAAIADATTFTITLCSDTAGATPVDTFIIPAISSSAQWIPLTLARVGGGNLGASIQSIAINSAATAPTNSSNVTLNNFIACTTDGLSLTTLITKNSSAQGGTEGYFGIQSINDRIVLLDLAVNSLSTAGRGYSGTSETVTTYIRSTFKPTIAATSTTVVSDVQDSGTAGNNILFKFGYEVGTTNQNGETILDGQNGNGTALQISSKNYITIDRFSCCRYNLGLYLTASTYCTLSVTNASNNTSHGVNAMAASNYNTFSIIRNSNQNLTNGLYLGSSIYNTITEIGCVNGNASYGVYLGSNSNYNTFTLVNNANNNAIFGIYTSANSSNLFSSVINANNNVTNICMATCSFNRVTATNVNAGSSYGFYFQYGNRNFITIDTADNNALYAAYLDETTLNQIIISSSTGGGAIYSNTGENYFSNSTFNQSTEFTGITRPNHTFVWSLNHDDTLGNHWGFGYQATVNRQTAVVHGTEPCAWKTAITGSTRGSLYPVRFKFAEVAFNADSLVTVKAWVKKDNATTVASRLITFANPSVGINADVSTTKADDTDWEELTITFTPTEAGVTEIYLESWYVSGNSNTYLGTITVTQA